MALSFTTYTGDGTTKDFVIPFPYLLQTHITATIGLLEQTPGVDYTIITGGTIVRFTVAPAAAAAITIRRESSRTQRITSYVDGAALTKEQLDTDALQNFFLAQEAYDHAEDIVLGGLVNPLDQLALSTGGSLVGGSSQTVDDVNDIRQLSKLSPSKYALALGGTTRGDGLSGSFYLDPSDTSSSDNGVTVIVATDGGRWKKAPYSEALGAIDASEKVISTISTAGISYSTGDDTQLSTAIANIGKRRNRIINGNFSIWQRATTQTTPNIGSADRWLQLHANNTTKTSVRLAHTLGQVDVPGNPKYYLSTAVTAGTANAANLCYLRQTIEDVLDLSGRIVTLSFYAKASANCSIATSYEQNYGTGGGESSGAFSGHLNKFSLTTSWARYSYTFQLPSSVGRGLGTNGDDYTAILFWFSAGASFNTLTNNLGEQSRTIDISNVQLEPGQQVSDFEFRTTAEELVLCQRYYEQNLSSVSLSVSAVPFSFPFVFKVTKRAIPSVVMIPTSGSGAGAGFITTEGFLQTVANSASVVTAWKADAELL